MNCPPNLDFEKGDFSNWQCYQGYVDDSSNNTNVVQLYPTAPGVLHTIIPASNRDLDFFGNFPKLCPNGSKYSIMLGNNFGGHEAEGVSYTFTLPATSNQFSITYNYAVVLENPEHEVYQQPRFRARVIDVTTGSEIDCVSFDFAASSSLPGFKESLIRRSVMYKDWTPVTIDLSGYAGKTLKLEFIASDCTFDAHFGYAYVDVNSNCSNTFVSGSICEGDSFATLTAPYGFQSYQWFSDNSFITTISDSQMFYVNPLPPEGTIYPLIVTPYPGFGCMDTMYATIKRESKPQFDAGPDRDVWCNDIIQLGSVSDSDYSWSWIPSDRLTDPAVSNPRLNTSIFNPVNFIVKVTDKTTGCMLTDSVLITPRNCILFVPTAFTPDGDGLNDELKPYLGGIRSFKRFSVFNRYGNLVFSTTKEGAGWNGSLNGVRMPTGVFVWVLEYIALDGRMVADKGTVVLIR